MCVCSNDHTILATVITVHYKQSKQLMTCSMTVHNAIITIINKLETTAFYDALPVEMLCVVTYLGHCVHLILLLSLISLHLTSNYFTMPIWKLPKNCHLMILLDEWTELEQIWKGIGQSLALCKSVLDCRLIAAIQRDNGARHQKIAIFTPYKICNMSQFIKFSLCPNIPGSSWSSDIGCW